jgi:hypothetical protein
MKTALLEVLVQDFEPAVSSRALDACKSTVEVHMILHVTPLAQPRTASLGIRALDKQVLQHRSQDSRDGEGLFVEVDVVSAGGTALMAVILCH